MLIIRGNGKNLRVSGRNRAKKIFHVCMLVCGCSYTVVSLLASPSLSRCSLTEENTFFLRRKLAGNTGTKLPADLANRQKIIIFPNPAEFPHSNPRSLWSIVPCSIHLFGDDRAKFLLIVSSFW